MTAHQRIQFPCAVQKLQAASKENDEQQSQIFRLEVRLAETNKKLEHTADLEKELLHYRYSCWRCNHILCILPSTDCHQYNFHQGILQAIFAQGSCQSSSCRTLLLLGLLRTPGYAPLNCTFGALPTQLLCTFEAVQALFTLSALATVSSIFSTSCRKLAKDAEKRGQGGLWGYISGT